MSRARGDGGDGDGPSPSHEGSDGSHGNANAACSGERFVIVPGPPSYAPPENSSWTMHGISESVPDDMPLIYMRSTEPGHGCSNMVMALNIRFTYMTVPVPTQPPPTLPASAATSGAMGPVSSQRPPVYTASDAASGAIGSGTGTGSSHSATATHSWAAWTMAATATTTGGTSIATIMAAAAMVENSGTAGAAGAQDSCTSWGRNATADQDQADDAQSLDEADEAGGAAPDAATAWESSQDAAWWSWRESWDSRSWSEREHRERW